MAPDVRDPAFWSGMDDELWEEVGETFLDIYLQGVEGGINALPANVQVLANAASVNTNALDFLKHYRLQWLNEIIGTTHEQTLKIFEDWIRSGSPLPVLEKALEPVFGTGRAETIAVTETTRIFAQGNQSAWEESGLVDESVWMTAEDELVCPICGELDGTHIGVGDIDASPPAHVNCRCWLKPIVSEEALGRQLDQILQ